MRGGPALCLAWAVLSASGCAAPPGEAADESPTGGPDLGHCAAALLPGVDDQIVVGLRSTQPIQDYGGATGSVGGSGWSQAVSFDAAGCGAAAMRGAERIGVAARMRLDHAPCEIHNQVYLDYPGGLLYVELRLDQTACT